MVVVGGGLYRSAACTSGWPGQGGGLWVFLVELNRWRLELVAAFTSVAPDAAIAAEATDTVAAVRG